MSLVQELHEAKKQRQSRLEERARAHIAERARVAAIEAQKAALLRPATQPLKSSLVDFEYELAWRLEILGEDYSPTRKTARPHDFKVEQIQREVCRHYGVAFEALFGDRGSAVMTRARHVGIYICRQLTPWSYPALAKLFGGMDHSTLVTAVKRINIVLKTDAQLRASIEMLTARLGGER